jgi:hypothetical protein
MQLTREEILQSSIHHGTAALDYSHEGWGVRVGWCIDWYFCIFLLSYQVLLWRANHNSPLVPCNPSVKFFVPVAFAIVLEINAATRLKKEYSTLGCLSHLNSLSTVLPHLLTLREGL